MIFKRIELTNAQRELLTLIKGGYHCKVFKAKRDNCRTYNIKPYSTAGNLYNTSTVRTLIKKGLIKEELCDTKEDNSIGHCALTIRAKVHLLLN